MFTKELYGKDLIAFGTGYVGKAVIPSLGQDPSIRLIGVTNSQIGSDDEGTFMGTTLPLRSIHSWAKIAPNAAILVTATDPKAIAEIFTTCQEAGFQEIIPLMSCIADPILKALPIQLLAGYPMLQFAGLANEIRETHMASFSEFKACYRGQTVAVVGAGPTLNYYSQIKQIPHIGVNGTFQKKQLKLDYYFLNHYIAGFCEELKKYSFVKFFGHMNFHFDNVFPEYVLEENHARRYFLSVPGQVFRTNIEYYPMTGGFNSVIFNALQFAIYVRPKRILLVGCDCTNTGHFDDPAEYRCSLPMWLDGYRCFKEFIAQHYPDTEVISINPVGLRGMFHDVYTKNYLDDHPELDPAVCELFDTANYKEGGDL